MTTRTRPRRGSITPTPGITQITVAGFKSIADETSIDIAPLTILAGANSSGKSSIMQPLLLLKQTLEAPYDPGPLLLNGPNVTFTSTDQLLSRGTKGDRASTLRIGFRSGKNATIVSYRASERGKGFEITETLSVYGDQTVVLKPRMSVEEVISRSPYLERILKSWVAGGVSSKIMIGRERYFLRLILAMDRTLNTKDAPTGIPILPGMDNFPRSIVHVPGLRGNTGRYFQVAAASETYPGLFNNYVARIISEWQSSTEENTISELNEDLGRLGLTWKVEAVRINDAQVELRVGRLNRAAHGDTPDTVSIADVGFGVSTTLPVLVALRAAKPGQLVYLEQPEIHLHPRAQIALGEILADAAIRGVRVVAETHSSLLILSIQSLVAEGKLNPKIVRLHWFSRGEDGCTQIEAGRLDSAGAFGEWPEDFDTVTLEAQSRYLNAAGRRPMAR